MVSIKLRNWRTTFDWNSSFSIEVRVLYIGSRLLNHPTAGYSCSSFLDEALLINESTAESSSFESRFLAFEVQLKASHSAVLFGDELYIDLFSAEPCSEVSAVSC